MRKYLTIDGMLSGTGIRDTIEGGYIDPESLGLHLETITRLKKWLEEYEEQHYCGFKNKSINEFLDAEGRAIARLIKEQLLDCKIEYFSDVNMRKEDI
jgi:hypothetical protein